MKPKSPPPKRDYQKEDYDPSSSKGDRMITIYSTPSCPRCRILEQYLSEHKIAHFSKEIDAKDITDMRVAGFFDLECPIIEVNGAYYGPNVFFDGMALAEERLRELV